MPQENEVMDIVLQEEPSGCGIACVAMVSGQTYPKVRELANGLGIFADDTRLYSDTEYVRRLLAEYGVGVSPEERPFTSWNELPNKALLSIKYHVENGKPVWHWVVFSRENGMPVVLDPAKYLSNNRRTDFEEMQPKWFVEIYYT